MADTARDNEPGLTPDALPPLIETRQLCLRPPTAGDIAAISRLINHPEIALNLSAVRYPFPPISAWGWLASARRVQDGAFHRPYLLHLRANPRLFAGAVGLTVRPGSPPEIGYWLGRPYRRRGYASEAARALILAIFANSGVAASAPGRKPAISRPSVSSKPRACAASGAAGPTRPLRSGADLPARTRCVGAILERDEESGPPFPPASPL